MTDNGDGTYSYTFSVTKEGTITYKVLLLEQGKVSAEYYTKGGSFIGRKTVGNINFNFGSGSIYGGYKDNVVIHYRSYLKPPRSATFSFSVKYDDYGTVYIDGSKKTSGGQTTTRRQQIYRSIPQLQYNSTRSNNLSNLNKIGGEYSKYLSNKIVDETINKVI